MSKARSFDRGMSRRRVAVISLVIILIATFFSFTKDIPFTHGYRITAYFRNSASIKPNSPVRISGVNVGKVKKVTSVKGSNNVAVEMEIKHVGLPIHADATAKIRARLFLEGNFFVELKPGTPDGRILKSGSSIPVAQTSSLVQLDQ